MAILQPNSGKHIDEIVNQTACDKHNAKEGTPCWYIKYDRKQRLNHSERGQAVCGDRIKKAGFIGRINPISLSMYSNNKAKSRGRHI